VVLIGFDYRDYNAATAQLLANLVRNERFGERWPFVRADVNAAGVVHIVDAIVLLEYLCRGGPEPPCLDAAGVDDSAVIGAPWAALGIADAIRPLHWLFRGAGAPPPPAPQQASFQGLSCGHERRARDGLGCASYPCQ
jgi:hypothetical protein